MNQNIIMYTINKRTAEYKGNGIMLKRMEDGRLPNEALNYQPRSGGNRELSNKRRQGRYLPIKKGKIPELLPETRTTLYC